MEAMDNFFFFLQVPFIKKITFWFAIIGHYIYVNLHGLNFKDFIIWFDWESACGTSNRGGARPPRKGGRATEFRNIHCSIMRLRSLTEAREERCQIAMSIANNAAKKYSSLLGSMVWTTPQFTNHLFKRLRQIWRSSRWRSQRRFIYYEVRV